MNNLLIITNFELSILKFKEYIIIIISQNLNMITSLKTKELLIIINTKINNNTINMIL